jgi:Probable zinc-ribbon domain
MNTRTTQPRSVASDPEQWSEKSKNSVAYHFKEDYSDIEYLCWRCKAPSVFTAEDQKYTFEVKKASRDQRRILCASCWSEANKIRATLEQYEIDWLASKNQLQRDSDFLRRWLDLLVLLEKYVPYKPNTAKKNMLNKLLNASTS